MPFNFPRTYGRLLLPLYPRWMQKRSVNPLNFDKGLHSLWLRWESLNACRCVQSICNRHPPQTRMRRMRGVWICLFGKASAQTNGEIFCMPVYGPACAISVRICNLLIPSTYQRSMLRISSQTHELDSQERARKFHELRSKVTNLLVPNESAPVSESRASAGQRRRELPYLRRQARGVPSTSDDGDAPSRENAEVKDISPRNSALRQTTVGGSSTQSGATAGFLSLEDLPGAKPSTGDFSLQQQSAQSAQSKSTTE